MGSWDMISTSDEVNFIYYLGKGLRFSNGSTPVEITFNCEMQLQKQQQLGVSRYCSISSDPTLKEIDYGQ